jgi:hypothetical protein
MAVLTVGVARCSCRAARNNWKGSPFLATSGSHVSVWRKALTAAAAQAQIRTSV